MPPDWDWGVSWTLGESKLTSVLAYIREQRKTPGSRAEATGSLRDQGCPFLITMNTPGCALRSSDRALKALHCFQCSCRNSVGAGRERVMSPPQAEPTPAAQSAYRVWEDCPTGHHPGPRGLQCQSCSCQWWAGLQPPWLLSSGKG